MPTTIARSLSQCLDLVEATRDILVGRVTDPEVPPWCRARGWETFLLGLSADEISRCESLGPAPFLAAHPSAPEDLRELAVAAKRATAIAALEERAEPYPVGERAVPLRKERQLQILLDVCRDLSVSAERIVDVGSGRGHLTRLASRVFGKPALGVERERDRLDVARRLSSDASVSYLCTDAVDEGIPCRPTDLVIGLHACGDLGDLVVRAAATEGASVVLVSCCFQKTRAEARHALSEQARRRAFSLPRATLGVGNLGVRSVGVDWTIGETMSARSARHALRAILRARGVMLDAGAEMHGVNRRRAYDGLPALTAHVLRLRGLPPATDTELALAAARADTDHAIVRRLSIPRTLLARLVEVTIVLDRAAFLEEHGYQVRVAQVFDDAVSPRNLGILGRGPRSGASPIARPT